MARTGRPPKPTEQKRRAGNPGRRPLPDKVTVLKVEPVAAEVVNHYDPASLMDSVLAAGGYWLTSTDGLAVSLLREAIEERAVLREEVMSGVGSRRDLRELDKQIIAQLSALGFDPVSRGRLGLVEVQSASTLEKLKAARGC